jgi:NAD(P)-dependent dehydrogenase (short-subunit alcohol dehydrogenase family)
MAVAIIVGVGPGLGWALVQRFASAGFKVAAAARDLAKFKALAAASPVSDARLYPCDAAREADVEELMRGVERKLGSPDLVVFNAGAFEPAGILDVRAADFERCWRVGCLGGFHVGQAAARAMVPRGAGTIIFTGATASLRGGVGYVNLAVPKFGLRALAQSMARELGPKGIHVAHVVIDGQIALERAGGAGEQPGDARLAPAAIAEAYFQLHVQHRSAWTHELDLRPWVEKF